MKTGFALKKVIGILLIILVSTLACKVLVMRVSAEPATRISIIPADQTVGDPSEFLPTDPFTINITVTDVTDLYAWSVRIFFDNTTLALQSIDNATDAWLPDDHVFSFTDMYIFTVFPYGPEDPDWGADYVTVACTLIGPEPGFTGSGVLCQINFKGIVEGSSALTIDRPPTAWTFLEDSTGELIEPFEMADGSVTVIGVRYESVISINVSSDTVSLGSNVTISGNVTGVDPTTGEVNVGEVNVTIWFRTKGLTTWGTTGGKWKEIVKTDSESRYSHSWTTTGLGKFEIMANWTGKDQYPPADSQIITVEVKTEKKGVPPEQLYIIVGVILAVLIILAIVVYFLRFRKRE